jgi:hypothetical protein
VVFGDYEWDDEKAATNLEKHAVSFMEASSALQDPHAVYLDASTATEERFAVVGLSADAHVLTVVHVERRDRDRIISARFATASEEALYTQG